MIEFLQAIWGSSTHGYGELRMLGPGSRQEFYNLLNPDALDNAARDAVRYDGARFDVYFGVLSRRTQSGAADAIFDNTRVLWADLDAKGRTQADCFAALGRVSVPPQIIVDSGHGYHAYWLLSDTYPAPWGHARLAMKGIAKVVGGDAVYDKARVLRVPGTHNYKVPTNPKPSIGADITASWSPVPVRLVRFDPIGNSHPLSDFVEYTDIGADMERPLSVPEATARRWLGSPWDPDKHSIPDYISRKMDEDPGKGARSEHVFSVVCSLLELGLSADEIEDRIRAHPYGVGVKYFEKGTRAHDWLGYAIREAQRRVGW